MSFPISISWIRTFHERRGLQANHHNVFVDTVSWWLPLSWLSRRDMQETHWVVMIPSKDMPNRVAIYTYIFRVSTTTCPWALVCPSSFLEFYNDPTSIRENWVDDRICTAVKDTSISWSRSAKSGIWEGSYFETSYTKALDRPYCLGNIYFDKRRLFSAWAWESGFATLDEPNDGCSRLSTSRTSVSLGWWQTFWKLKNLRVNDSPTTMAPEGVKFGRA